MTHFFPQPTDRYERELLARVAAENASLEELTPEALRDTMNGETDPLLGGRDAFPAGVATDGFTMPREGGSCRRFAALPRFVTIRGGAYFFLPGLRALRFLAREPG